MTAFDIKCERCNALLGSSTDSAAHAAGYFCEACLAWRAANAIEDVADPDRHVILHEDGRVTVAAVRRLEGQIIGVRQKSTTVQAALTSTERTTLRSLLVKLWQAAS